VASAQQIPTTLVNFKSIIAIVFGIVFGIGTTILRFSQIRCFALELSRVQFLLDPALLAGVGLTRGAFRLLYILREPSQEEKEAILESDLKN
jgi:hypothetical protein